MPRNKKERLSTRLIVFILVSTLLVNTTFAAPEATRGTIVAIGEIGQDIRFGLSTANFGSAMSGWANNLILFFAGKRTATQQSLSRIEITPGGELTVRQGEPTNYTAFGYTSDGQRISGLRFNWSITDADGGRVQHNLPDGVFPAKRRGTFTIRASARGVQEEVNVVVTENRPLMMMKKIKRAEANGDTAFVNNLIESRQYSTGQISSKQNYRNVATPNITLDETVSERRSHGPNASDSDAEYTNPSKNSKSRMMMRPADDDGWGSGNWWQADDPGNQVGNPPGSSPDAGAGNGNFQFSAPVVSLPGRGIDLSLSLNYNSRVWSKAGNVMSFDAERGFPGPGWNLGFGKMMFMGTSGGCMLIDADGTNRAYTGTISNFSSGNYSTSNFTGYTTDGSFTDYSCAVTTYYGVTTMSGTATLPSGTKVSYNVNSTNGKQAFPTSIMDAQGNYINVSYLNNRGPNIQTVTDTMGRVVTFNYDSLSRLISVDVPKLDNAGTRTAVRIHYKQLTLSAGFAYPVIGDTNNPYPYVVDAIYYPGTGTGYWFNDSDSYSTYGMISKIVEQRGMSWSGSAGDQGTVGAGTMSKQAVYNYPLAADYSLTDAPTYTNLTETWDGMDTSSSVKCSGVNTNASVTCYSINMNSSPRTITVTQPNGVKSKQTMYNASGQWNDGLIYQDETLDSSNNQLSKSVVTWAQGAYNSPRPSQTEVTDEKSQVLKTTYTYGSVYNQLTSQKKYDYDGTTVLNDTRNTYENSSSYTGRHIFSLLKTTEIYDGAATPIRLSKTDYEYDGNAVVNGAGNSNLKAASGVTMHSSDYDQYTTDLKDGVCSSWDPAGYSCSFPGEEVWIPTAGGYYETCDCTEYEQVSVYDPNTVFRGNLTKTTVYADAALVTPTVAISQTKQYDITGNVVAESASCCELKTYDYTATTQYAYPTTQTRGSSDPNSPLRNTATSVYDFNTGLLKQATDPNGRTSSTTYNADTLRPTNSTTSTGAYSQTTYNESAMTVTEEVKDSSGVTAGKTITYLNGLGQVKREDSVGPAGVTDITENKYDQLGRPWKHSRPYRSGDTVQWSENFYDLQGRKIKIVGPDGSETKAFYNETQRPDSASNLPGNTVRVMDAWGRERWGRYNSLERLAEVVEPNPTGNGSVFATGSLVTNYTFDQLGRFTQSNQGGQLRKLQYDSLGRLTRQKLAEQTATINDSGTYVGAGGTWSSAFTYDSRSNITQRVDARGVKTDYSYKIGGVDDPLNRIQEISYDLGGPRDSSKPIAPVSKVKYEYMTSGDQDRLKKAATLDTASAEVTKDELAYDIEGRVTDQTKTILNRSSYPMVTSYTYDTLGRVTQERQAAQYGLAGSPRKLIQNSFDESSRLTSLVVNGTQQAGNIVYNASDQTTSINIGASGTNQISEQYTFDAQTGLLINQKAIKNGSSTLLDLTYDYSRNNSVGTLNGKTGHLTKILNNLDHNKDREYQFDAVGRLTVAKGKASNQWTQTYTYDRFGNRTNVTATGTAADGSTMPTDGIPTLAYNSANNQITTSGYEYDVAGNQTRGQLTDPGTGALTWNRFEYDAANRLVNIMPDSGSTPIQSQTFGVGNERIALKDNVSNQITYFGSSIEYTEFGGNGVFVWSRSLVSFGGSILSTITPNGSGGEYTEFNHPDRLGTRLLTNQTGGTSYEQAHLPFGKALNAESTVTTNSKRFTSYERSARTELDYAQNRTYDSKQGRFTQVDPIGMAASSLTGPQTLNLYTYCGNDPINHTDPSGLFWGSLFKWIGNIVKAILIAVAVVVAVVAIFFPPTGLGAWGIAKALIVAGNLIAAALAPPKIGAIIGIASGIVLSGPGIIVNIANAARRVSTWQRLLPSSLVGAIANSFARKDDGTNDNEDRASGRAFREALYLLKYFPDCAEYVGISAANPTIGEDVGEVLNRVYRGGNSRSDGILTFVDNYLIDTDEGMAIGQTQRGKTIKIAKAFFDPNYWKKKGLTPRAGRVEAYLHELKHFLGGDHRADGGQKVYQDKLRAKCISNLK